MDTLGNNTETRKAHYEPSVAQIKSAWRRQAKRDGRLADFDRYCELSDAQYKEQGVEKWPMIASEVFPEFLRGKWICMAPNGFQWIELPHYEA